MKAVDETRKRGLGRGLSALLGEPVVEPGKGDSMVRQLPVTQLRPGRFQPRRYFDAAGNEDLTQ